MELKLLTTPIKEVEAYALQRVKENGYYLCSEGSEDLYIEEISEDCFIYLQLHAKGNADEPKGDYMPLYRVYIINSEGDIEQDELFEEIDKAVEHFLDKAMEHLL